MTGQNDNAGESCSIARAASQGGMLLSQATQDVAPLRDALGAAIDYVASFAPGAAVTTPWKRAVGTPCVAS